MGRTGLAVGLNKGYITTKIAQKKLRRRPSLRRGTLGKRVKSIRYPSMIIKKIGHLRGRWIRSLRETYHRAYQDRSSKGVEAGTKYQVINRLVKSQLIVWEPTEEANSRSCNSKTSSELRERERIDHPIQIVHYQCLIRVTICNGTLLVIS
jgi:hypothetical protein